MLSFLRGDTEDYFAFAQNDARILARNGITLEVRFSPGSTENLTRRLDPHSDMDIAFLRGRLNHPQVEGDKTPASTLTRLATIAYEPLWVFYRYPHHLVIKADPTIPPPDVCGGPTKNRTSCSTNDALAGRNTQCCNTTKPVSG